VPVAVHAVVALLVAGALLVAVVVGAADVAPQWGEDSTGLVGLVGLIGSVGLVGL
jgi:hypothetical protein